jgi:asparagine synthase (glutamine-hydrolysing)
MCGICGKTDDPHATAVAKMSDALRHRGPDDDGTYLDKRSGVALGARRLSIIDVAGGHQPLSNEDGSIWAVFNGEIYNHPALRARLTARGHDLQTGTDTEVLVHLYEDFGEAMVHALEGMYAFALWDERRGKLLIARDRFGEKPLFYRTDPAGCVTFASELTPLVRGLDTPPELLPEAMNAFFVLGYVPSPMSIVRGVKQLLPGHILTWDRETRRTTERQYWAPAQAHDYVKQPVHELTTELRAILERSVASRMIADVPLGVLLSGGVDSTLIAALAARRSDGAIKTFTVGYDVGAVDESVPARRAAAAVGSDHHELILTEAEVARRVPALLRSLDQPLADQALVPTHAVAEFARQEVKVVISGEGADEVFGGYPRYRWLARGMRISQHLPSAVGARAAYGMRAAPVSERVRRLGDVIEPGSVFERNLDWVTARRRHMCVGLYGERLIGHAHDSPGDIGPAHSNGSLDDEQAVAALMRHDQLHWLPDDILAKADRAGMLVSLEVRTPYLNRELAEFAGALGPGAHTKGEDKALLRALLSQLVPKASARRRKTAFRVPSADWLRGPLSSVMHEQVADGRLIEQGWFERRAVARLVSEHQRGQRDNSAVLWPLMTLELWLEGFEAVS